MFCSHYPVFFWLVFKVIPRIPVIASFALKDLSEILFCLRCSGERCILILAMAPGPNATPVSKEDPEGLVSLLPDLDTVEVVKTKGSKSNIYLAEKDIVVVVNVTICDSASGLGPLYLPFGPDLL